jgi:hypothetical protein
MDIEVTQVTVNRNLTDFQILGQTKPYQVEGSLEIEGSAIVTNFTSDEMEDITDKSLTLYAEYGDDSYLLKDCRITGYNLSATAGSPMQSTVDFVASDMETPAFKKIKFKDGERKVDYKYYSKVKDQDLNKMTYKEFRDKVMVEEL